MLTSAQTAHCLAACRPARRWATGSRFLRRHCLIGGGKIFAHRACHRLVVGPGGQLAADAAVAAGVRLDDAWRRWGRSHPRPGPACRHSRTTCSNISCSIGSTYPTLARRSRSTTPMRCAVSSASISAASRCPTRPPSAIFVICWSATISTSVCSRPNETPRTPARSPDFKSLSQLMPSSSTQLQISTHLSACSDLP